MPSHAYYAYTTFCFLGTVPPPPYPFPFMDVGGEWWPFVAVVESSRVRFLPRETSEVACGRAGNGWC
jgi:hypothetical protein